MAIITALEVEGQLGLSSGEDSIIVNAAIIRATGAVKRYLKYDPEQKTWTEYYPMMDFDQTSRSSTWEVEGPTAVLRREAEAATSELQLRNLPIRGGTAPVVSVDYDGRSGTSANAFPTNKTEGVDFHANYDMLDSDTNRVCMDGILRSIGAWPTTAGSVRVVYTGGYSAAEIAGTDTVIDASPIWDATLTEAVRRVRASIAMKKTAHGVLAGPLVSERLGDYNYKLSDVAIKQLASGSWDLLPETIQKLSDFVNYGWSLAS